MGDIDLLIEMGFPKDRAQLALKKVSGLSNAIDWLEKKADVSTEDLLADETETNDDENSLSLQPGEEARSLLCKDCGKRFRNAAQAEFHASKTEHANFEESTEEIAPLTEEEKKAKLEELRQKLAAKRAGASEQDKIEKKRNEEIRRKATKESQDIKEQLQKKELLNDAAKKKREKQEDILAKQRIKDKIAADKEERRQKAEREKAERAGQTLPTAQPIASTASTSTTSKPASAYTETRLRLQTPQGNITKSFNVDTTLFEVAAAIKEEKPGFEPSSFVQTFPKKTFDAVDFGATLKELGLVPSSSLLGTNDCPLRGLEYEEDRMHSK